jgi:2,4-dienoyl-CoA reductase-like NADH-dependent reductase (Old Yellow Enzyme family)
MACRPFWRPAQALDNGPRVTVPSLLGPIWARAQIGGMCVGEADAVAFGRLFSSNPDLPSRLHHGWPLTPYDATRSGAEPSRYLSSLCSTTKSTSVGCVKSFFLRP